MTYPINTLTHILPISAYVACSGGSDSSGVLEFLSKSVKILGVIYINHNQTNYAYKAQDNLEKNIAKLDITKQFDVYNIYGESEEEWRKKRLEIFTEKYKKPVILGHHLDDCIESYVMNFLYRGFEGTIPYSYQNCIRPFRAFTKAKLKGFAGKLPHGYVEDPTNLDSNYCARNYVRNEILKSRFQPNLANRVLDKLYEQDNVEDMVVC